MMVAGKKEPDESKTDSQGIGGTLRDNAEELLARSPKRSADLKGQTTEQLIHYLQVHEIELKTQAEELRRAHLALEESRDKYLDLYEFAPIGYFTLTGKALITGVNLTAATLLGVERINLVNHGFGRFITPGDIDPWDQYFMHVRNRGEKQTCTLMLKRGDGSIFPARLEGVRMNGIEGELTIRIAISDITDIWQIEALRESEDRFRNVIDAADAYVFEIDADGVITFLSDRVEDILGYKPQELIGKTPFDTMTSPEEVARVSLIFGEYQKSKLPIRRMEHNCRSKDGRELVLSVTALPMFDAAGEITGYQGTVEDITGRKQAEEALRETNEYLNNLFDYANAPIIVWDPGYTITRFNHAFEDLTLRSEQEVIGQRLDILFPKESRDTSLIQIKKTVCGERWETVEIPILVQDGSVRTVLWNSANILNPDGRIISTIAQGVDITDRKIVENTLVRVNQKLNILSQLTRKDLTNQTFVLSSYLELTKNQLTGQDRIIETLQKGVQAARLIHETIEYSTDYRTWV